MNRTKTAWEIIPGFSKQKNLCETGIEKKQNQVFYLIGETKIVNFWFEAHFCYNT